MVGNRLRSVVYTCLLLLLGQASVPGSAPALAEDTVPQASWPFVDRTASSGLDFRNTNGSTQEHLPESLA